MPNAYNNQAGNVPPFQGGLNVGQKVKTIYGIGTITNIRGTHHQGLGASLDPLIATILIPNNPPVFIEQPFQSVVFYDSGVGGEMNVSSQINTNL